MKAITIEAKREGYKPEQAGRTMSVSELIDLLVELADAYGEECPVFVSNDNGYTYGSLSDYDIDVMGADEEE